MSAQTDNSTGAEQALTSYIDAMLGVDSRGLSAESGDADDDAGGVGEWQAFDFGRLSAALPAERILRPGYCPGDIEVKPAFGEPDWLHRILVGGRNMAIVDMRRLVLPDSLSVVVDNKFDVGLRIWEIAGRDIALAVESAVAEESVVGCCIHRCGVGRRRKWLAGTQVDSRLVFIDIDGLVELIDSLAVIRAGS